MARVAVGGFHHETNSFSPQPADLEAFRRTATLPGLTVGDEIPARFAGLNAGLAGGMERLRALGHEVLPTVWASAVPSGPVTREAFDRIAGMLADAVAQARPDAVFLDLHGAMVADGIADAEAEIISRVRAAIGGRPLTASFDLHANLSADTVALLDGLAIFRTYPHLDMAETGARAASLLDRRLKGEGPWHWRRHAGDFLVPLHAQATGSGPAEALYALARGIAERPGIAGAELALGFPPADVPHAGPGAVVGANGAAQAEDALAEIAAALADAERDFAIPVLSPGDAVRLALAEPPGKPVVIADTQDNPGAGGAGDTVGLLAALLDAGAEDAVFALLHDPDAVALARQVGAGGTAFFRLGGRAPGGGPPVEAAFAVERLVEGPITATGPMYRGNVWDVGTTAVLRREGVRAVVAERRLQAADRSILRHAGIDPEAQRIVVLKSTVHFRADWEPVAGRILVAAAPGLHAADNRDYPYRRLRPDVRRMPGA